MKFKIRVKNEKKAIIIALVFLFIVFFSYSKFVFSRFFQIMDYSNQMTSFVDKNSEPIFKIKEIILYSSAYANDNSEGEILRDLNIHQFTDISITIDNKSYIKDLSNKNTVSELYIDNIRIQSNSNKGVQLLNYKNPYQFGKFTDMEAADSRINFNILHTNEDNKNNDFSSPTFFTDCSNPITLGYVNKNILKNSKILNSDESIDFNGKLLKIANIKISDIAYRLTFQIHLKNSLEESFVYNVDLNMPLEDENSSIYDGYIFKKSNNASNSYYFLREED